MTEYEKYSNHLLEQITSNSEFDINSDFHNEVENMNNFENIS